MGFPPSVSTFVTVFPRISIIVIINNEEPLLVFTMFLGLRLPKCQTKMSQSNTPIKKSVIKGKN